MKLVKCAAFVLCALFIAQAFAETHALEEVD